MTLIFILHSLTLLIISNRISAVIIMLFPLMDVNSDLLYSLVEKFYSTKLFYLTILFYIIPNLTFLYRIYELRARPYFISSYFLIFLKDFIWIAIEDSHPTFHKKTILWNYPQHDDLFKVVFYIVKWIFVIALQIISIILMIIIVILSLPLQIFWLFLGIVLFQSKVIAVNSIWNEWFYIWSGDITISEKKVNEIDFKLLHQSKLLEFTIESAPQLIIQTINNFHFEELGTVAIFSSSFSVFMICNGIYKYLYYMLILKINIEDIPVNTTISAYFEMYKKMFRSVIKLFSKKKSKNNNKDAILDDEKR